MNVVYVTQYLMQRNYVCSMSLMQMERLRRLLGTTNSSNACLCVKFHECYVRHTVFYAVQLRLQHVSDADVATETALVDHKLVECVPVHQVS